MDLSAWRLRARDDPLPFQALIDSQNGYALVTYNMPSSNPVKRSARATFMFSQLRKHDKHRSHQPGGADGVSSNGSKRSTV